MQSLVTEQQQELQSALSAGLDSNLLRDRMEMAVQDLTAVNLQKENRTTE